MIDTASSLFRQQILKIDKFIRRVANNNYCILDYDYFSSPDISLYKRKAIINQLLAVIFRGNNCFALISNQFNINPIETDYEFLLFFPFSFLPPSLFLSLSLFPSFCLSISLLVFFMSNCPSTSCLNNLRIAISTDDVFRVTLLASNMFALLFEKYNVRNTHSKLSKRRYSLERTIPIYKMIFAIDYFVIKIASHVQRDCIPVILLPFVFPDF